ncbi:MAG: 3-hydroxyacyl-CoA dehydrogenase NAD-binding domain-containing protein, partial [Aestuariivirgaceae bacterium]
MAESKAPSRFETLAVIGNGIIGHGVAQVFATAGKKVVLVGRAPDSLERALKRIRSSLGDFVAHELLAAGAVDTILRRITPTTRLEDAAAAELVIEAVTEDLALKRDLFARLDKICPPPAVLASSSGQPASALV